MVILADKNLKEHGSIKNANITVDVNKDMEFSIQIARSNWIPQMTFSSYMYKYGTEYGGIIGEVMTDTTLDYVELKGYTWRGLMQRKIVEPPLGADYKKVSGELHTVMKSLIEGEFDGLFVVSSENTGITVSNYQFERYCTLISGIEKMLKEKEYKLQITFKREQGEPGYVFVEAVPIVDYSDRIELSKDSKLNFNMRDKRNGINHLIVTGKGELQERNVFNLYAHPDGSIKTTPYYRGLEERTEVYENTSTETDELMEKSIEHFKSLMNKNTFGMDVEKLRLNIGIGDIVGGRDYLTGMYMAKPIENIVYEIIEGKEYKSYKLEGEDKE